MSVSSFSSAAKPGVCLSTDRPDSPFDGQVIYETDTNRTLVYDNSAWVVIHDPTLMSYSGTGVTVTADAATIGGENVTPYTGRRNLLYNGAMQVNQRGQTASSLGTTSGGYYTADRWLWRNYPTMGTWTNTTEVDAPDGFEKSFKTTCVTADASPASTDFLAVQQRIEGADLQHLKWGTSNAEQVTLSFWVKSNVTGTYAVPLEQPKSGGGFSYVTLEYTINSSATWEHKVLTFPANTVTTMVNTTGIGLTVWFALGCGSDYVGGDPQDTWGDFQTAGKFAGDQVNLASAVGNYWQVTGVQLEVGDKATPFEWRPYGEELALCKRYFFRCIDPAGVGVADSSSRATRVLIPFNTEMRATPTSGVSGTFNFWNGGSTGTATALLLTVNNRFQGQLDFNGGVGSAGQSCALYTNGGSQYIDFAAEL